LFKRYEALANAADGVTFVGRLAQYRYYNMDQCVGAALKASKYVLQKLGIEQSAEPAIRTASSVAA
jgi:UDP-galactopyranose mutase